MKFLTSQANAMRMPHYERRALVASRMRELRENSGLSQRDVCRTLHAKTEPSAVQLATLSGLYGVSVLWLLGMPSFVVNAAQSSSSSS